MEDFSFKVKKEYREINPYSQPPENGRSSILSEKQDNSPEKWEVTLFRMIQVGCQNVFLPKEELSCKANYANLILRETK